MEDLGRVERVYSRVLEAREQTHLQHGSCGRVLLGGVVRKPLLLLALEARHHADHVFRLLLLLVLDLVDERDAALLLLLLLVLRLRESLRHAKHVISEQSKVLQLTRSLFSSMVTICSRSCVICLAYAAFGTCRSAMLSDQNVTKNCGITSSQRRSLHAVFCMEATRGARTRAVAST